MIHFIQLLVLTALILASFVTSMLAQAVSIPDPGLNAAIREALQKANGPLSQADLLSLTNLDASQRNISSIIGLEAARDLVSLNLQINQLSSFSLPNTLTNLMVLDLNSNSLSPFIAQADWQDRPVPLRSNRRRGSSATHLSPG